MALSFMTAARLAMAAAFVIPFAAQAQDSDWEKEFWQTARQHASEFERTTRSHFEQMRGDFNAEYAEALNGVWRIYVVKEPTETPIRKEPDRQPVAPAPDKKPTAPVRIIPERIVTPPSVIPPVPQTRPENPTLTLPDRRDAVKVDFFGVVCDIGSYNLPAVSYNAKEMRLGNEWKKLENNSDIASLLADCLRLREALSLCDVGYLWLCEQVAAKIHPADRDSQIFLTSFLLNQSGYDVKLGLTGKGLTLLMHTDLPVNGSYYLTIDNKRYYIREHELGLKQIVTYDAAYAPGDAIPLRMVPDRMPLLDPERKSTVSYSSKRWTGEPEFTVTVSEPEMEFFKGYPMMSWENYIKAPLSENFRSQVIETLRGRLVGLNTFDGVRKLLEYVQFGFDYMTDTEQYHREKINFPEENFYYPANDCEDRSILFATLVSELYGLDVVFLHYDMHLSTAVDFSDPTIKGDFLNIDGHHYVMCDPTFLGARIGMSMPQYKDKKPEVYRR